MSDPNEMPKWRADEIFDALTSSMTPITVPAAAKPDPFDGPAWPRWYAQDESALLTTSTLVDRMIGLVFVFAFGIPTLFILMGTGVGAILSLVLVPTAYVRFIGRRVRAYSGWNVVFWGSYVSLYAVLFIRS